jgi:hypothetical protein
MIPAISSLPIYIIKEVEDGKSENEFISPFTPFEESGIVYSPVLQKMEFKYLDGSSYIGFTLNGKKEGYGSLTKSDQQIYSGFWKKDRPYGAFEITVEQKIYEATFNQWGKISNTVKFKDPSGKVFEGAVNGAFEFVKKTKVHYPDGKMYHGQLHDFVPHGRGTMYFTKLGSTPLTGNWVNGKWQIGAGVTYNGGRVDGVPHGLGAASYPAVEKDGQTCMSYITKGIWAYGKLVKKSSIRYENGAVYRGELSPSGRNPHGKGVMKYPNGDVYEGDWVIGEMDGYGVMNYANGSKFEGNWCQHQKDGLGYETNTMGVRRRTYWNSGKPDSSMNCCTIS